MGQLLQHLKEEFVEKSKVLEQARKTLKSEFVGIDKVIDEVIDNVGSWYTLCSLQERPIVINLWGLTGTGKTSLVNRLAELLNYENLYHRFDLGEKYGNLSFSSALSDLCENKEDAPLMIALDEFQHSRTIKGMNRDEIADDRNRTVWELIDSGKVRYIDWNRAIWPFETLLKKMQSLLGAGITVKNGKVSAGKQLYCREMEIKCEPNEPIYFFPQLFYIDVIDLAGAELGFNLISEVEKHVVALSAHDTIKFMQKVVRLAQKPAVKSFSKSVIFVLGNIDEAYTMSGDFSADIDADEFYNMSLKINVPTMKRALRSRFRDEQIARLGNIHIIYPALNSNAFKQIIENELKKTGDSLNDLLGVEVAFEESVISSLYKEGVYPTQGVRPLFTTIHHLFKSKLNAFILGLIDEPGAVTKMSFSIDGNILLCSFYNQSKLIKVSEERIITHLGDLRDNRLDDLQAITAVHESGHAILSALLLKNVPKAVYSVSSDEGTDGFVYSSKKKNYLSKADLINMAATGLGGIVAEEVVFGKDNITAGSSGDIKKVTSSVMALYKEHGFSNRPMLYSSTNSEDNTSYHNSDLIEEEVKSVIEQAKTLAEVTLTKEKPLLLALSNHLSDNACIKEEDLTTFLNKHGVKTSEYCGETNIYRKALKEQVAHTIENSIFNKPTGYRLNKNK